MQYDDFVLQIEPYRQGTFRARVLQSPAGEASNTFTLPFEAEVLIRLLERRRLPDPRGSPEQRKRNLASVEELPTSGLSAHRVGEILFDCLFSGPVRSLLDQSLGGLRHSADRGLRIKLKLDPGEGGLAGLPWELICRAETGDFLGLSRLSPIVRYLDVPRAARPILLPSPLRILVAVANPQGLVQLDLLREQRRIAEVWGRVKGIETTFLDAASTASVRQALVAGPFHVLHFMGHGDFDHGTKEGVLFFESEQGQAEAVSGPALATKLKDLPALGLVVLNACNTARLEQGPGLSPFSGVASALVLGGLPAVVAMQLPISDRAAICFSEAFYQGLAAGDSVDEALTEGRQAIHSGDPHSLEWATPVLFLRVPDGKIFQERRPPPSSRSMRRRLVTVGALTLAATVPFLSSPSLRSGLMGWLWPDALAHLTGMTFPIDQEFASSLPGIHGRLQSVELLPNGRMRLIFELVNETNDELEVGLDRRRTYIADEHGNRYRVLTPAGDHADRGPAARLDLQLGAGERTALALEFPSPRDHAQRLNVRLVSDQEGLDFRPFAATLPNYPEQLSIASDPLPAPPGGEILDPGKTLIQSNVEGLTAAVNRIELLADQRMRWRFDLFNRSDGDLDVSSLFERLYLADELGHRYPLLAITTSGGLENGAGGGFIERWLRREFGLEFPAPRASARRFTLVFDGGGDGPRLIDYQIELPPYPEHYAVDAESGDTLPPGAFRIELDRTFETSLPGLEARLRDIDLIPGGTMRWRFQFLNQTGRDLELGLDYDATTLTDQRDRRYRVVAASSGVAPDKAISFTLPRALREDHWLDFSGPLEGADRFQLGLVSHSRHRLSFSTVQVGPLSYPDRYAVPAESGSTDPLRAEPTSPSPMTEAPPPPSRQPPPTATVTDTLVDDEIPLSNNIDGLTSKVVAFLQMDNGSLRVELEVVNGTSGALEAGLDIDASYLADDLGTRYRVIRSGVSEGPPVVRGVETAPLPAGSTMRCWLDFPTPKEGAKRLFLVLASPPGSHLRFTPLPVSFDDG